MKTKHWVIFILLGLIWSSSFLWIKIGVQEIGPIALVAFRMLFGALTAVAGVTLLFGVDARTSVSATPVIYLASVLAWGGVAAYWALRGPAAPHGMLLVVFGWLVLIPCWWAVVQARAAGALFMFLLMGLIWVADIAAYFAGRRFGKHKLAPAVSPGKTWEGVGGALAGAALLAILCALGTSASGGAYDSWFAWLFAYGGRAGPAGMLAALLMVWVVVGLSIVGDLFESLLKRRAGVKDSSGLLPGHGGVLDRIDSLIPTMPLAMLIMAIVRAD